MLRLYMSRTIVLLRFQAISKLHTRRVSEHAQPLNTKKLDLQATFKGSYGSLTTFTEKEILGSEAAKIFLAKRKYVTDRFRDL